MSQTVWMVHLWYFQKLIFQGMLFIIQFSKRLTYQTSSKLLFFLAHMSDPSLSCDIPVTHTYSCMTYSVQTLPQPGFLIFFLERTFFHGALQLCNHKFNLLLDIRWINFVLQHFLICVLFCLLFLFCKYTPLIETIYAWNSEKKKKIPLASITIFAALNKFLGITSPNKFLQESVLLSL